MSEKIKVGDMVIMPGQKLMEGEPTPIAIVLKTKDDRYQDRRIGRVKVYWIQDEESAWEPQKWLKVINESR